MRGHIHIPSKRLKSLGPLLSCWVDLNVRYARAWKWRDCAWWYDERTFVGLLAAAAWQIGGHSLEEYATRKNYRRNQYSGRGDLYFELNSIRYIAEAKHDWVLVGHRSRKIPKRLGRLLRLARDSVIDAETKGGTKLGLLFIAPMVPKRTQGDATTLLNWLMSTLREEVSYDAAAWVFPKETKSLKYRAYIYPGVALLILSKNQRSQTP